MIGGGETGSSLFPNNRGVLQASYGGGSLDGLASKFRIGVPIGLGL